MFKHRFWRHILHDTKCLVPEAVPTFVNLRQQQTPALCSHSQQPPDNARCLDHIFKTEATFYNLSCRHRFTIGRPGLLRMVVPARFSGTTAIRKLECVEYSAT